MKDQYVGNISDYRKFAILRVLSGNGRTRIGVCWMATPSDCKSDGRKINYFAKPKKWRKFDPRLFDMLNSIAHSGGQRRMAKIAESDEIPGAVFDETEVPIGYEARKRFINSLMSRNPRSKLIFFDPDNGLNVPSVGINRQKAARYVFDHEVRTAYKTGRSVLFHQHFPRVPREAYIDMTSRRLRSIAPDATQWVFCSSQVAFFLLAKPIHRTNFEKRITEAQGRWTDEFLNVRKFEPISLVG